MNELWALRNTAFQKTINAETLRPSDKDIVHNLILSRLPTHNQPLAKAAAHHFNNPGKMLRATMAMRGAHVLNVSHAAATRWAAAIEVLHNASLIHDDICDGDKQRRGHQAIWTKFGRNVALTLGDWLIALSFELAAEAAEIANTPRLLRILAKHMAQTTAGEAMEFEWDGNLNWDAYLTIAADKTAPLLTAPLQGVVIMVGDYPAEQTIASYFRSLGEAYQIANDISNFNGSDGAKLIAGDLARRAPNAVTISFFDGLQSAEQARFNDWYKSGDTAELAYWRGKVLNSKAINTASVRMFATLERAASQARDLSAEISEVIMPVHGLIMRVCETASKNGAA